MIRIEETKDIPELMWLETSSKEFRMMPQGARKELIRLSDTVKIIYDGDKPLLVGGIYYRTFLSTPYFWALLSKELYGAKPSVLRSLVLLAEELIPWAETMVEEKNEDAFRLARLFKFQPRDNLVLVGNRLYRIYRRRL